MYNIEKNTLVTISVHDIRNRMLAWPRSHDRFIAVSD